MQPSPLSSRDMLWKEYVSTLSLSNRKERTIPQKSESWKVKMRKEEEKKAKMRREEEKEKTNRKEKIMKSLDRPRVQREIEIKTKEQRSSWRLRMPWCSQLGMEGPTTGLTSVTRLSEERLAETTGVLLQGRALMSPY